MDFHDTKYNSAMARQNQLESQDYRAKDDFLSQYKHFAHLVDIFGLRPFIVKSLKGAWDQQSLIDSQNFDIINCISS